jgi:hypothetical protein
MADLPYTHTDRDGQELSAVADYIIDEGPGLTFRIGGEVHSLPAAEFVVLARRALPALETGFEAMDAEELSQILREEGEERARSMRERIIQAIDEAPEYAVLESVIRALPLLPGGDTTEEQEQPVEDFDAGWAAGHAHASADADRITELEKLVADLSDLVHGHGEDIGQAQAAIRGLGKQRTSRPYNAWTDG